ncbi:hypothetical protein Tco_1127536, partial [Tanacetum coccineum]
AIVDEHISTRIGFSTQTTLQSYTAEFENKAQAEKEKYIDIIEKSVKEIIKDEVKSQLPQILPKEIYDFATPVIQSTINESLENVVLAKSSSQPQSTYEAATSLTEFELKKNLGRKDKDKDEDPSARPDQGLKKRKTSKDVEPSRGSKSKESKSRSSKGSKSQSKSYGKSAPAEEPVPLTPDRDWNIGKQIDFRPPQTWISKIATAGKPPTTFDELMSTLISFSAYVLHNLKTDNLTQKHLVGPAFNLIKGTCKSRVELKFHFKEYYKAVTDKLDWTNPEGHEYPLDLSKPLPLIEDQGRQAAKYDTIEAIEDMVPLQWSLVEVAYDKYAIIIVVTYVKVVKKYDYGYLDEIIVRREDQKLHKFVEGDFPRLNLHDIEDMLLLLVQKKLSNLERGDLFDLNVALQIFTRCVVILKRVEDLQLGVKSYQKQLNITRPETFMVLHDIASSLEMDYLPKIRWSKLDRKRCRIMIKAIDQQLFERRLMRNLEKFVGGRE